MLVLRHVLACTLAVASALGSAHPEEDPLVAAQILTDPYAYDFPRLGATGGSLFPMRHCHGFKLEEATVDAIQEQLSKGVFTSVQLLECYLDRIAQTQPYLKYVSNHINRNAWCSSHLIVLSFNIIQMHMPSLISWMKSARKARSGVLFTGFLSL